MPSPLTEQQHAAVQTTKGPVCIVGGAGTGKTHTLIARVAHLIQIEQVVPSTILVLTFTNKAANQLNEYLSLNGLPQVHATTFYGLAAGFLRQHFRQDFKILSATEQEDLLRELLYSHERDELAEVGRHKKSYRTLARFRHSHKCLRPRAKCLFQFIHTNIHFLELFLQFRKPRRIREIRGTQ